MFDINNDYFHKLTMSKKDHHSLPEPNVKSSDYFFRPTKNSNSFLNIINEEEKQRIMKF